MEEIKSQAYSSIQSYWRRRTYKRLQQGLPLPSKKKHVRVRLGAGGSRRSTTNNNRRSWIKIRPILRVLSAKVWSPIKLLARLRDAYVDSMLALAGGEARPSVLQHKRVAASGEDGSWERRMPKARQMSTGRGDFERRMMLHIYRSLVAPPEVIGY